MCGSLKGNLKMGPGTSYKLGEIIHIHVCKCPKIKWVSLGLFHPTYRMIENITPVAHLFSAML